MKAVIMAGGEGTRLRPLTANQPKPMLAMANRPMMEHIVDLLRSHGFDEIVVTVAFMANAVRTYFGDGSEFGVRMVYATEETPLGTAGSVRNAMDELGERFLVISGDVLTDIDLGKVLAFHEERGALATIALKSMENPLEFGIVITKEDGQIERFLEKPTWGQVFSDTVNTGIYVLEPEVFDFIPAGRAVDFSSEVFPAILESNRPLYGYVAKCYWEDVGNLDAYLRAHYDILDGKVHLEVSEFGFEVRPGVWLGEGAELDPEAKVDGPALIGVNCRVGAGAHLAEYCVLGANVRVGPNADIQRSVVHDNAYLAAGVRLRGSVLGRACDLRQGVQCDEGVVLGDECFVGAHASIRNGVKVYPFKTVETGAIINSSIVWESRGARTIFGREGVRGLANVDVSPELAVRLCMAYASTLPKGSMIVTSRDSSRAARVLKRAVMVGANAAGIDVEDLEVAPVPVTRYHVRATSALGGVSVRLASDDRQSVLMRFFDEHGIDIDEVTQKKIERVYYREEFRRALAGEIGDIGFPSRTIDTYAADLMDTVEVRAIRKAHFKVVLDYAYGTASFVMPNVLAKLGAEVLAVNPFAATAGATGYDPERHASGVAALVRASRANLGAVIDPDGEHLTLVDDSGKVLSDDQALLALLSLVLHRTPDARVALPVAVSRVAEEMARKAGAELVWTKLSTAHLMEIASEPGMDFAASQSGGFIFPRFLPAYDAVAAFVHLLSLLAGTVGSAAVGSEPEVCSLSAVVRDLPPVHIAYEAVVTPWDQKGMLMRQIVERSATRDLLLVDGVKILDPNGWILVVPDPEEPLTHVWAEDMSDSRAKAKAQDYAVRLRQMLR
ncbi:MAG: sugar phosphate nucleotidyltransferase [Actinobacteria bacterium]|nr:sugar phosphate nucleotidyltransferase [Actinomycetota bacterium]